MSRRFAAAAVLLGLTFASPAAAKPGTRVSTVIVDQLAFEAVPQNLRVGDTIVWINRDLFRHSATSPGHFDVDLPSGARRAMVLRRAGAFPFICKYHPGMKGVLKVRQ